MTPSSSALTSNKSVAGLVKRVGEQLRLLIPKSESGQGAVSGLGGLSVPARVQPLNHMGTHRALSLTFD
jgi:hypothetical protein